MKKYLSLLLSLLFLLTSVGMIYAQETEPALDAGVSRIVPAPGVSGIGQNHAYSVTFRGNGEAVVSLKINKSNVSEEPIEEYKLRQGGFKMDNLEIYQVSQEKRCSQYRQEWDPDNSRYVTALPRECISYYNYGQNKYYKADYSIDGDEITIELPQSVEANNELSLFIYFRTFGFTSKNVFGAYNYSFESLKSFEPIASLRVGINTDSDFFLKQAQGSVDYKFEQNAVAELRAPVAGGGDGVESTSFDSYYGQIGYGRINKTSNNLDSLEAYMVEGMYAKSLLMLWAKEILIGIGILAVLVGVGILVVRAIMKKVRMHKETPESSKMAGMPPFLMSAGMSFAAVILMAVYTGALYAIITLVQGIPYYGIANTLITIVLAIVSFGVYVLSMFGPSIWVGVKKGVSWGFLTFGLTILWMIILSLVVVLVVLGVYRGSGGVSPIYGGVVDYL